MPLSAFLPSRKTVASLAVIAAVIGLAVSFTGTPRDPKYKGRRLSAWVNDLGHGSGTFNLNRDDLKAMGPAAVKWLTWAAEHGHVPAPYRYGPRPSQGARLMHDLWQFLIPGRVDEGFNEKVAALRVLQMLGPDAASAQPMLARLLTASDGPPAPLVAAAIVTVAPTAWPTIEKCYQDANTPVRIAFLESMTASLWDADRGRQGGFAPVTTADGDRMQSFFVSALGDPDPTVRIKAAKGLAACSHFFPDHPTQNLAIPILIKELSNPDSDNRWYAANALKDFGCNGASAIPSLIDHLDDKDANVRAESARALGKIDLPEKRSARTLQEHVTDPDPRVLQAIIEALHNLE